MINNRKNGSDLVPVEKRKRVIKVENTKGRRRNRRRIRKLKMAGYILGVLLILLTVSVGTAFVLFYSNSLKVQKIADTAMPELRRSEDGGYELSWHTLESSGADYYHVNVSTYSLGGESAKTVFFDGNVEDFSCSLPNLPSDEGLILQIDLYKKYSVLGKERISKQASIKRNFSIQNPMIHDLNWSVDPEAGTAFINFVFRDSNICSIYVTDQSGEKKLLRTVEQNSLELNLNEEEGLWIPAAGTPCTLTFEPGNYLYGMAVYGDELKEMTVTWEDFAARDIHLSLDLIDGCVCRLEWDEVDCDFYEVQMMSNDVGSWETVKTVTRNDACSYVPPRLGPGAGYSFRIAANMNGYAAVSEVLNCEIDITPLYCTIWPVKDLKAYSDAAKSETMGTVKAMDALCVVAEENGMFGVKADSETDAVWYIDSNFCMINLPEYVGFLCNYDITNSYSSIFMAHGFEIPGLTGEIIKGYENVYLSGDSLVPLLYPTAKKLVDAIDNASAKGYRLKIYDAFRPHDASVYMYQKACAVQDTTLPEETYWGNAPGVILEMDVTNEDGATYRRRMTYWELMSGNSNAFTMTAFVAAGISRHNLGVAMDLTLESLSTKRELFMQTDLHDLSHYSARSKNNDFAKELSDIMMSAGFKDLYSEWWHFQDDEIYNKLSLPCVNNGVSAECWMENGFGRRYRGIDGTYAVNCTLTIDGIDYNFDSDGYVRN